MQDVGREDGHQARSVVSSLGLHPLAAVITVIVDSLLFGSEVLSGGTLICFSVAVAFMVGWLVFRIQQTAFGDDAATALTKAIVISVVTAIPTPLTPVLALPGGALGTVQLVTQRRGRQSS